MDFIICDQERMETGILPDGATIDFDLGNTNDVEMTCLRVDGITSGMYLICPGTEYGAVLEEVEEVTSEDAVTWRGNAFRKFLEQYIIEPPSGQDYRTVSGEAHAIMRDIMGHAFGGLFEIPETDSGIVISSYKFNRYTDALSGFNKMLSEHGSRVNIEIKQGGSGEAFKVELTAAPIQNLSKEIEYSQDSEVSVTLKNSQRGITHLICLGQGELKDRMVIHLYAQLDGSVKRDAPYYTGFDERTEVYDYSNAVDEDELLSGGTERLKELMPCKSFELTINSEEEGIQLGDIIAARNYDTGLYVERAVSEKIVKVTDGLTSIEYKVEGD